MIPITQIRRQSDWYEVKWTSGSNVSSKLFSSRVGYMAVVEVVDDIPWTPNTWETVAFVMLHNQTQTLQLLFATNEFTKKDLKKTFQYTNATITNQTQHKLDSLLSEVKGTHLAGTHLAEIDVNVPAPDNDLSHWWYTAHDKDNKEIKVSCYI